MIKKFCFTNLNSGVFASSRLGSEEIFKLARECLGCLADTRNNNGRFEEVTKERAKAKAILKRGMNSNNPIIMVAVVDVYNDVVEGMTEKLRKDQLSGNKEKIR